MKARLEVPARARRGDAVPVRIMIRHPMETGFRRDDAGRVVPKNVVSRFACRYNGEEVFRAELGSGISVNPLLQFYVLALESGEIECAWSDDAGEQGLARAPITVSA
ncbi:MAG TPA: thiosulfate oxidation carrier complex protein SoxZ [Burkholderiales bacterium]|nr:thiosulfate oxidation carrier complex protein SoxZ [Burkholderiales bacterium]